MIIWFISRITQILKTSFFSPKNFSHMMVLYSDRALKDYFREFVIGIAHVTLTCKGQTVRKVQNDDNHAISEKRSKNRGRQNLEIRAIRSL